jgi:hypothetical protein
MLSILVQRMSFLSMPKLNRVLGARIGSSLGVKIGLNDRMI